MNKHHLMKITKIKTKTGKPGTPVTTELDTIVERMRSEDTKETAARIAAITLKSRLAMEQGAPRFKLGDCDRLPYLLFTATFGKRGLDHPLTFTQLLPLSIPCPDGMRQVEEIKRRVVQLPYTLLAFAGVSGVSLSCPRPIVSIGSHRRTSASSASTTRRSWRSRRRNRFSPPSSNPPKATSAKTSGRRQPSRKSSPTI